MENLSEKFSDLKGNYRKIFSESVGEIRYLLASGFSRAQIEAHYQKKFEQVWAERGACNCAGCGACCRFAVSEFSPEELVLKAQNGDDFASQFIKTFVPYDSVEEARKIYPEYVEFLEKTAQGNYYFYHCPKVTEDNRCPDYENRPQICRDFPEVYALFLPKTCSFTSWNLKSKSVWLKMNAIKEILDWIYKE